MSVTGFVLKLWRARNPPCQATYIGIIQAYLLSFNLWSAHRKYPINDKLSLSRNSTQWILREVQRSVQNHWPRLHMRCVKQPIGKAQFSVNCQWQRALLANLKHSEISCLFCYCKWAFAHRLWWWKPSVLLVLAMSLSVTSRWISLCWEGVICYSAGVGCLCWFGGGGIEGPWAWCLMGFSNRFAGQVCWSGVCWSTVWFCDARCVLNLVQIGLMVWPERVAICLNFARYKSCSDNREIKPWAKTVSKARVAQIVRL